MVVRINFRSRQLQHVFYLFTILTISLALMQGSVFAAGTAPVITGINPISPIEVSSLQSNSAGLYTLNFSGSGFTQSMRVRVDVGNRQITLPYIFINPSLIKVFLKTLPTVTTQATFTFTKRDAGNVLPSNPFAVDFLVGGANVNQGDHLATFELANPAVANPGLDSFVLHGTVPVPAGLFSVDDLANGNAPFGIVDINGNVVDAQVEGVTKTAGSFPGDPNPDFDLIELAALVNVGQAQRSQYRVVLSSHSQPIRPVTFSARSLMSNPPTAVPASIKNLFAAAGSIKLRAYDVFGHEYVANITDQFVGKSEILRFGDAITEIKVASVLTPVSPVAGAQGTLPHLMGAIAYFRVLKNQEALGVDLIVHNAMSGVGSTHPAGSASKEMYFSHLELEVAGSQLIQNALATPYTEQSFHQNGKTYIKLIKPILSGKMNYLGMHKQVVFRMAISPSTPASVRQAKVMLTEQNLAFSIAGQSSNSSMELFSFHNDQTAAYGPVGYYLPTLAHLGLSNVRSSLSNEFNKYNNLISQGQCNTYQHNVSVNGAMTPVWDCAYPLLCGVNPHDPTRPGKDCGPTVQMGVQYYGMTSGSGIVFPRGFDTVAAGSNEGYRHLQLDAQFNSLQRQERMYNLDGKVTAPDDTSRIGSCGAYTSIEYFIGFSFSNGNDPFSINSAPTFQINYVSANNLKPNYQADVDAWQPHDGQHYIRASGPNMALLTIGNDSLARNEILALSQIANFQHLDRPQKCSGVTPVWDNESLQLARPTVPHIGLGSSYGGREGAHMTMINAAAYSIADEASRNRVRPNFEFLTEEVYERGLTVTGRLQRGSNFAKICNAATCPGFSATYSTGREHDFNAQTVMALENRIFRSSDPVRATKLKNIFRSMYYGLLEPGLVWKTSWNGPRGVVILSPPNSTSMYTSWGQLAPVEQLASDQYGPDAGEFMMGMGQAREVSGDDVFSTAASLYLGGNQSSLLGKLQTLSHYQLQDGNKVHILACAQRGKC